MIRKSLLCAVRRRDGEKAGATEWMSCDGKRLMLKSLRVPENEDPLSYEESTFLSDIV